VGEKLKQFFASDTNPAADLLPNLKFRMCHNTLIVLLFGYSFGSDGEQPSDARGKVQCESAAVPQL
jgi:hypothetical protein